jgi:hypothetical protein
MSNLKVTPTLIVKGKGFPLKPEVAVGVPGG